MKNNIVGKCPVCNDLLYVTELQCDSCDTKIQGEFYLSKFSYLKPEQLYFIEMFIKNRGSIKAIEKELGISYPTVKKNLDEVITALGYELDVDRMGILKRLDEGEITSEDAAKKLNK